MLIKWIIITPGNALDLFQTSDIVQYFESNSYEGVQLMVDDIRDVFLSPKDTEMFQFLFDSTDKIRFKCFTNCKFMSTD